MKTITVDNKDYILKYAFEAAEHKETVQNMFNVLSGAYLVRRGKISGEDIEVSSANAMIEGVSEMVSEIPHICVTSFYAGLLEENPLGKEDAKALMRAYMKENKVSYRKLFEEIKKCMEDDGFFDLSGLTETLTEMNANAQEAKKIPKQPQDHKKSTSTK